MTEPNMNVPTPVAQPPSDAALLAGVMVDRATGKLNVWAAPGVDPEGLFLDGLKAMWELRMQERQKQQSQIMVANGPIPGM